MISSTLGRLALRDFGCGLCLVTNAKSKEDMYHYYCSNAATVYDCEITHCSHKICTTMASLPLGSLESANIAL
jgi:hypothetical protein